MISRRSLIQSIVSVGLLPFTLFAGRRENVKPKVTKAWEPKRYKRQYKTAKSWELKRYKRPVKVGWLGWIEVHGEGIVWIDLDHRVTFCKTQYNQKRHIREAWELIQHNMPGDGGVEKLLKVHGKIIAYISPINQIWFLDPNA